MPNFNPFSSDDEDTSFERGTPISQGTKNATQAMSAKTQDQANKITDDIVNQLYGPSTPQDQGTDEANTSQVDHSNAASRAVAHAGAAGANKGSTNVQQNPNKTPEEQAEMERIRHELFGKYKAQFQPAQNGAHNIVTDLEQEMEKARKEREQKEMQRKQEEEQEESRREEEKLTQQQELAMPAGKKTGFTFGKKQQQPMAVQLEKTKTESNRGTSG
jgi:hypothetical protein